MSELKIYKRSRTAWTPVSYTANETATIIAVAAGDLVLACFARVRVAFDGTSPDISIGDGSSVNRFMTTTNVGVTATGLKRGTGAGFTETLGYLYTAADTIDITFTAATGSPTVGTIDVWCYIAKIDPH